MKISILFIIYEDGDMVGNFKLWGVLSLSWKEKWMVVSGESCLKVEEEMKKEL